ncbi:hypothetical protein RRF57_002355 [Xylaria bambusicola]|uniref:Uncharacterized protein n=1 Tax=Xylaria bambusicola TaxID=326684 RepID=A0AAN7U674_9PEZI
MQLAYHKAFDVFMGKKMHFDLWTAVKCVFEFSPRPSCYAEFDGIPRPAGYIPDKVTNLDCGEVKFVKPIDKQCELNRLAAVLKKKIK